MYAKYAHNSYVYDLKLFQELLWSTAYSVIVMFQKQILVRGHELEVERENTKNRSFDYIAFHFIES